MFIFFFSEAYDDNGRSTVRCFPNLIELNMHNELVVLLNKHKHNMRNNGIYAIDIFFHVCELIAARNERKKK